MLKLSYTFNIAFKYVCKMWMVCLSFVCQDKRPFWTLNFNWQHTMRSGHECLHADSFTSFCCPLLISALTLVLLHKYEYGTFTSVFQWNLMLSGKQSDLDLMSTDVFTRFSQLILDLLSFLKMTYPVSAGQGFIHHFMGHWQTVHNQIRYDIMWPLIRFCTVS